MLWFSQPLSGLFLSVLGERSVSYPTGSLLIEFNQDILVILAGEFFYLLDEKLISLVTFVQ